MRRTPKSVGSFSTARRGSSSNAAVTAILAAVLNVLKIPKTFRFANSNACLLVMHPEHRMDIPNSFAYARSSSIPANVRTPISFARFAWLLKRRRLPQIELTKTKVLPPATDASVRDPEYLVATGFPIACEQAREGPHRSLTRVYPRQLRAS